MNRSTNELFIPDFRDIRIVFALVVVAQLLAFVLVLTPGGADRDRWGELALVSFFVQWVALSSAGVLSVVRGWLQRLGNGRAGALGILLVLLVTAVLSEAAYWLTRDGVLVMGLSDLWHREFILQNLAISGIVAAVALRYFYLQFQWRNKVRSEAQARVQALQSRIRPHFLFNSMNTIASLTRSQPGLAEQVVEDLADLFRISLGDASVPVALGRELDLCRQYLRIEQLRLGPRLRTQWRTDALPNDAQLPALLLQPLLENAVYHGVEPSTAGGLISVEGQRERDRLQVVISNSISRAPGRHREGNHLAQDNVRERLQAFFGKRADFAVEHSDDTYRVTVAFPYGSPQR
jgi:two-component system sensor histidine kinase AlgZ